MKKYLYVFSLIGLLLFSNLGLAKAKNQKNFKMNKAVVEKSEGFSSGSSLSKPGASAVLIGKTWNGYTTQSSGTNQIFYDPYSNVIAVVKRTDKTGAGSGRIVYQVSDDLGQNWSPQSNPVNLPGFMAGRHPSIMLSNPTKSASLEDVAVVNVYASLGATWRYLGLSTDASPLADQVKAFVDSVYGIPQDPFVNNNGDAFTSCWYQENPTDSPSIEDLFVTRDKGASWQKIMIADTNDFNALTYNVIKGDFGTGEKGYAFVEGIPYSDATGEYYDFGFKKTNDNGATFDADWTWVDYLNVSYDGGGKLGDLVNGLNYEVDMITFGEDNAMFVGTFITADTLKLENTGIYVITKIGNQYSAHKIRSVNTTRLDLPGSGALYTLNEVELARSVDGKVVGLKFCDLPTVADTAYDVFVSWYNTDGKGTWTEPENVTNTPNVNEKFSQLSSRLYYNSTANKYQMLPLYTLFGAVDGVPDREDANESELYFLTDILSPEIVTGVDDDVRINKYALEQNYPNPFNPSTAIKYSIAQQSQVSLKIYDVLGNEVAVLVNSVQSAGDHQVNFNANNLASGLYFYTITTDNFTATKKMMLLK